jgi:hypothetical protein
MIINDPFELSNFFPSLLKINRNNYIGIVTYRKDINIIKNIIKLSEDDESDLDNINAMITKLEDLQNIYGDEKKTLPMMKVFMINNYKTKSNKLFYMLPPSQTIPSRNGTIVLFMDEILEKLYDINYIDIYSENFDIWKVKKEKIFRFNNFMFRMKCLLDYITDINIMEFDPNSYIIKFSNKDFSKKFTFNNLLVIANLYKLIKQILFVNNEIVTINDDNNILESITKGFIANHFIEDIITQLDVHIELEQIRLMVDNIFNEIMRIFINGDYTSLSYEEKIIKFVKEFENGK